MARGDALRASGGELGIMTTHRCPIECRHCGILSGPRNFESMDLDVALRAIRDAAHLSPRPSTIVFTGGEPLMYPQRLEPLLEQCNRLGFSTRVVSNGFWARNRATGLRLMTRMRLAGLDAINFSADKYHLEFLDPEVLLAAFDITWAVGMPVIVNMVMNTREDPVEAFCRLYGVDPARVRLFDEDELSRQIAEGSVPQDFGTRINLSYGRLVGHGRAAEYPGEHLLDPLAAYAYTPCQEAGNRPVIYPDGTLQACCCAGGRKSTFTVGNLSESDLATLYNRMKGSTHFAFINKFGPRALYEAMAEIHPDRFAGGSPWASICDVCIAATADFSANEIEEALNLWTLKRFLAGLSEPDADLVPALSQGD